MNTTTLALLFVVWIGLSSGVGMMVMIGAIIGDLRIRRHVFKQHKTEWERGCVCYTHVRTSWRTIHIPGCPFFVRGRYY